MSDDEDSDDDDAGGDAQAINHISVTENTNSGRQERINQDDEGVINHISVFGNTHLRRQETVTPKTNITVTPGRRTKKCITSYGRNHINVSGAGSMWACM